MQLLKAKPGMLTDGHAEYLFDRTKGVVGLLERLLEDGCQKTIDIGKECLTTAFSTASTSVVHTPGRDAEAGEIPAIPPTAAVATRRRPRKKARSRFFHRLRRSRPRRRGSG